MKITKALTEAQKETLARETETLVEKIMADPTKRVLEEFPRKADGTRDFGADAYERPITEAEVRYLVDLYFALRLNNGWDHGTAVRHTYQCIYSGSPGYITRIAQLKEQYGE